MHGKILFKLYFWLRQVGQRDKNGFLSKIINSIE